MTERKTEAETNLQVLGLLRQNSKSWWPVSEIAQKLRVHETRLTKRLIEMSKRKFLKWYDEVATEEEKKKQRVKNQFMIDELGIKKYDKIAESCMDDEMRFILGLKN